MEGRQERSLKEEDIYRHNEIRMIWLGLSGIIHRSQVNIKKY